MEPIAIRQLRDKLAETVNKTIKEGTIFEILRDEKPIASLVPYNIGKFADEISRSNNISGLVSCIESAKDSQDNSLIPKHIINAIKKCILPYTSTGHSFIIIDTENDVMSTLGNSKNIYFKCDMANGQIGQMDCGESSIINSSITVLRPIKSVTVKFSPIGAEIEMEKRGDQIFIINGYEIKQKIDLELTRFVVEMET